jgi:hypothetical protein
LISAFAFVYRVFASIVLDTNSAGIIALYDVSLIFVASFPSTVTVSNSVSESS